MARILIIGASNGIGLETVKAILAESHTARAFARTATHIDIDHARIEKIDGDALDKAAVTAALADCDAVVQSLGVALSPATILSGTRLFSNATRLLVDAMEANGPKRLIVVTGLGAGDSRDALGPVYRAAFELSLRRIYDDKDVQEMIVRRSSLDWTILRPGFLTRSGQPGPLDRSCRVLVERDDFRAGSIGRSEVAAFIARHWNDPAYLHKTPVLVA